MLKNDLKFPKWTLLKAKSLSALLFRRQFLSSLRGLFESLRADTTEMTVATGTIVEHVNVIE